MGQRNVTVVAGVSGSGKSALGIRFLLNAPLAVRFLFDSESSERDPAQQEFSHRLSLPPVLTGYQLQLGLCQGWIDFDPHGFERGAFAGRVTEAMRFFCEWAWEKSAAIPGQKVIVIPEVWRYCSPQAIPIELATIVQAGRKRGLTLLVDTQEPNRLNSSILNGVSEMICFKLQSNAALDKVSEYGFSPDEVQRLQQFECIARNLDSGGELRGKLEV